MRDNSRGAPSGRLRFEHEESATTSGQVGPKSKPVAKSRKRFVKTNADPNNSPPISEETDTSPPVEESPTTSGQYAPKSGKFRQDSKKPRPSDRLRQEGEPPPDETAPHDGPADKKSIKDGKRMEKSKLRMEKSGDKLEKARDKLANQKPPKRPGPIKTIGRAVGYQTRLYVHGKIREVERENVGIEAAHKAELAGEHTVRGSSRFVKKRIRTRPARQVRKWEKKTINAKADYAYRQLVQENPSLQSNPISRYLQKQRLKKQYRKQAKETAKAAKKTAITVKNIAGAAWNYVRSNPKVMLIIACAFLLIIVMQSCVAGVTSIGNGLLGAVGGTSYVSSDSDMQTVESNYTALESGQREELAHIERNYPGYDEYRYSVDEIGHDPFELASYLTAKFGGYNSVKVRTELQSLLEQQYQLTVTETVEVRYRTETRTDTWTETDPETGETTTHSDTYTVDVPYDYYILNVTLRNKSLGTVALVNLDPEQTERYLVYQKTKGNRPNLFEGNIYTAGEYTDYDIPPEALNDTRFAAMIAEAEKYLGFPYVWGGSTPSTSFDCSGFVCWVLNQSGVGSVGRTTAQGIFNLCAKIPPGEAKPGDIIFFTGTYDSSGPVSHVGIYVGNGMMIHCGNPISYASINSRYWTEHFYAFGRLN